MAKDLSSAVQLSRNALDKWESVCHVMAMVWGGMGFDFDTSEIGEERLEMIDGELTIIVDTPAGTVTLKLVEGEDWRWRPEMIQSN